MTIAETAQKYDLTPDTLRYYERIGLLPHVGRTAGGIRDYQQDDCRWIEFIKCMRSAGLPVETLIEYVKLFAEGDSTLAARKTLLIEQREALTARISEMQDTLERLNRKIENYDSLMLSCENSLPPK